MESAERVVLFLNALVTGINALKGANIVTFDTARHHLNLRLNTTHVCGATLVSDSWLITAAQCVRGIQPDWLTVHSPETGSASHRVAELVTHPDFHPFSLRNDVALVKLAEPFNLTAERVRSVRLVGANVDFAPGTLADINGYGQASLWPALRVANATLITHEECELQYYQVKLSDSVICARAAAGAELEAGDGGGALMARGLAVGVASQQLSRRPAVYTRLAAPRIRSFVRAHTAL